MTKIRNYTRVLMGVGLLGLLVCSCKGKGEGQQSQQQQTPELAVITLGEDDATLETGFPATLQGTNDVEIRPQVSGFITKVCVQEGQHVSAGQTLFMIDRVQLEAAVEAAQAHGLRGMAVVSVEGGVQLRHGAARAVYHMNAALACRADIAHSVRGNGLVRCQERSVHIQRNDAVILSLHA